MHPTMESLALITPYDIDVSKVRIGPDTDGGYIMADILTPDQDVLSYGIYTEYKYDEDLAKRGHRVFMFDHTIQGIEASSENMKWFREGVAGTSDESSNLYTIGDHLSRFEIAGNRLILKLDVEGCEFDTLDQTPLDVLDRFEQICLEVHDLNKLQHVEFREVWNRVFNKLNSIFTLFHVHANNCDGEREIAPIDGFAISVMMELSYIKTSRVQRYPSRTLYPTDLDYPCVSQHREKALRFYPFLPMIENGVSPRLTKDTPVTLSNLKQALLQVLS